MFSGNMAHSLLLLSFCAVTAVHSAPLSGASSILETRQPAPKITSASSLAGINWFYAQAECGPQRTTDLQRAFVDVTQLAYAGFPIPSGDNPAFEEFFGVGYTGVSHPPSPFPVQR